MGSDLDLLVYLSGFETGMAVVCEICPTLTHIVRPWSQRWGARQQPESFSARNYYIEHIQLQCVYAVVGLLYWQKTILINYCFCPFFKMF
jgi:hypothetical protein